MSSKFDSSGNFIWARTWGGTSDDFGEAGVVDGSNNVYVTGIFSLTVDFDPGAGSDSHTSNGAYDAYVSKFDSPGNFIWARTWGGSGTDDAHGVVVDGSQNTYVTGEFQSTVDFDPSSGVDNHTAVGNIDGFLTKFDSSGNYVWARTWGGTDTVYAQGIAIDGSSHVYLTGPFNSTTDFDPGPGVDSHSCNGSLDAFLSKLDSSGNFIWARTWGGSAGENGYAAATDVFGGVFVTGDFSSAPTDFRPGPGVDNHSTNGSDDVFVSKFAP